MKKRSNIPKTIVNSSGKLTPIVIEFLSGISNVSEELLSKATILPASKNLLRAPWYFSKKGGAITIGSNIYFTKHWFKCEDDIALFGFLLLLSHEVGHLPQAEAFGFTKTGKTKYILYFTRGYLSRAIIARFPVHDGLAAEITADLGNHVFKELFTVPEGDKVRITEKGYLLLQALKNNDIAAVRTIIEEVKPAIKTAQGNYRDRFSKAFEKIKRDIGI